MSKYFNKPTIYLSHAIRGTSGDMIGNCRCAVVGARKIRTLFPEINLFLPADADLIIQILYNAGKLSEKNILWADFEILRACHGWCYYRFEESSGSERERQVAIKCGFKEHEVKMDLGKAAYSAVRKVFQPVVTESIKNFRKINEKRV